MPDRKTYQDIPGWFRRLDYLLFTAFLENSKEPGDLIEIGAFRGKSAVVIGDHVREGEKFVVIDIFGDTSLLGETSDDLDMADENKRYYPRLTLDGFTENYLSVHPELPVVVQAKSTEIVKYVESGGARFIHIDASHLYAGVAADCKSAKLLIRPGGVVAFDDWRNQKCPGVAAAIWESVVKDGMIPIATTSNKLYGVYSDPEPALDVVRELAAAKPDFIFSEEIDVMGHTLIRLDVKEKPEAAPAAEAPAKRRRFGRG